MRYVHADQAATLLGALLRRMSQAGPGVTTLAGCPFSIYHGAVTADSDGPVEIVRPMAGLPLAQQAAAVLGDIQARTEAAHQEAGVRLTMAQLAWPAQLPALDAIEGYLRDLGRSPAGPPRQIMIADWRTAAPDTIGAVLALPLTA